MKISLGSAVALSSLLLAATPASAVDQIVTAGTKASIEIMPNESEVDRTLEAICLGAGRIELRIGAELQIGKGGFDPVTVKISAGKASASLSGTSVKSPNFEMTGGSELLTVVETSNRALALLVEDKGSAVLEWNKKRATVAFDGAARRKLAAFVKTCESSE